MFIFCIVLIHILVLKMRIILCVLISAFLNEAGLNFVKQCIKLIETRGIPVNMSICRKMFVTCALSCECFIQFLYFSAGLTTPGLYRTGGVNSKVQRLMTSVFGKNLYTHLSIILT